MERGSFEQTFSMRTFRLLIFIVIVFSAKALKASHILGGEIYYDQLDSGRFVFTLHLYRDCSGVGLPSVAALKLFGMNATPMQFNAQQVALTTFNYASLCDSLISGIGAGGCGANNTTWTVQRGTYISDTIQLQGVPPIGGWTVAHEQCCRNPGIDNLASPGSMAQVIWTSIHPYVPTGQTTALDVRHYSDRSPRFEVPGYYVAQTGTSIGWPFSATDANADSLFYQWSELYDATAPGVGSWSPPSSPTSVVWASNYAMQQPLPGSNVHPSNSPAFLDPQTGWLQYVGYTAGMYVLGVKVQAWRSGQLISETVRDIPVRLVDLPGAPSIPSIMVVPQNHSVGITPTAWGFESQLAIGDTLAFTFMGSDFSTYPGTSIPVQLRFFGLGDILPTPLGTGNCGNPPCAQINPSAGQATYTSPFTNSVEFEWVADCAHFVDDPTRQLLLQPQHFMLGMTNLNCAFPGVNQEIFQVNMRLLKPEPPAWISVQPNPIGVEVEWGLPADTGSGFGGYVLYFQSSTSWPSAFAPIDTILGYNQTQASYGTLTGMGEGYYFIRSLSVCGFESTSSDTIHFMRFALDELFENRFKVWPNPSAGALTIEWKGIDQQQGQLEVLDLQGKRIYEAPISSGVSQWNLSLPSGVYQLRVKTEGSWNNARLVIH